MRGDRWERAQRGDPGTRGQAVGEWADSGSLEDIP